MKTKLYLNGKKTTKKEVNEIIGEEKLKKIIKESKEAFIRDPSEQNSYFLTGYGMFTVKFE